MVNTSMRMMWRDSPGAATHTDMKRAAMKLEHITTRPVIWDGETCWESQPEAINVTTTIITANYTPKPSINTATITTAQQKRVKDLFPARLPTHCWVSGRNISCSCELQSWETETTTWCRFRCRFEVSFGLKVQFLLGFGEIKSPRVKRCRR